MRNILFLLLILLGVSAVAKLFGTSAGLAGRIGIAALFCVTAAVHFAKPNEMLEMIPEWLPARKAAVLLSGVFELVLAVGLLFPSLSRLTGAVAVAFLTLITPLNIYSAWRKVDFGGHGAGPRYLLVRLPFQALLIAWTWWFAIRSS